MKSRVKGGGKEVEGKADPFRGSFHSERRLMLEQAAQMLESRILDERMRGRSVLLNLVLNEGSAKAKKLLDGHCKEAISSRHEEERRHARSMLSQLAAKRDCEKAKSILEKDFRHAIEDFDLEALVYLGMNGKADISSEVDAALERAFPRIVEGVHLDTLAYIAAMSCCPLETRRKAARISAEHEKRMGNLAYIHDASDDSEIKNIMKEALRDHL